MNNQTEAPASCLAASVLLFTLAVVPLAHGAGNIIEWADPATGGTWSTGSNWIDGSAPAGGSGTADAGLLGNATANRIVILDTTTSSSFLAGVLFNQTSAFENRLEMRRAINLTGASVSDAINLGASGGGSTVLRIETRNEATGGYQSQTGGTALIAPGGINVNAGGSLVWARLFSSAASGVPQYANTPIVVDGGSLIVEKALKTSAFSGTTMTYTNNGSLSLKSGLVEIGRSSASLPDGYAEVSSTTLRITGAYTQEGGVLDIGPDSGGDLRFQVEGNFTVNGGVIDDHGRGDGNGSNIMLLGATNTIASGVTLNTVSFDLQSNSAQSLTSGVALNRLTLRNGEKTIAVTAPGQNIGRISFTQSANNGTTSLRLDSDLTLKNGAWIEASSLGAPGGSDNTVNFTIDTNGHALDATAGAFDLTHSSATSVSTTNWRVTGGGTVTAKSFNLTRATTTSIGAATTLVATEDGGANDLGGGGTIDATSRFVYDGGAGTSATLQSDRAIGALAVGSGTLAITGSSDFAAQGGITVASGATLALGSRTVDTAAWTIGVGPGAFGSVTSEGSLSLSGDSLTLSLGAGVGSGNYTLFDANLSGTLASVSVVGSWVASLTENGGIWTGTDGLASFSFDQFTGILSVSVVPEPSAVAAFAGLGTLAFILCRRHYGKR
ncbi:hypothetical protein OpiT1DRAFT_05505 [Opitutaceae bacterium TAV1]|nr:hypothetical protein OpiT1DRAFT_05505 [Opitutaceae bacterium TAV1]